MTDDNRVRTAWCDEPFGGYDAVVLCDGDFPSHPTALQVLAQARYVCCCDGAARAYVERMGREPDAIVGDGDSLPPSWRERYAHLLHTVAEQDDNDMTKATRHCMRRGATRIAYVGATGKREDHTLGNITLLPFYLDHLHIHVTMYTDYGTFVPVRGPHTFASFKGQQVSVFNVDARQMDSQGLRWPVPIAAYWWQTTLNEALQGQFSIQADGTYMVYRTYEGKRCL